MNSIPDVVNNPTSLMTKTIWIIKAYVDFYFDIHYARRFFSNVKRLINGITRHENILRQIKKRQRDYLDKPLAVSMLFIKEQWHFLYYQVYNLLFSRDLFIHFQLIIWTLTVKWLLLEEFQQLGVCHAISVSYTAHI